MKHNATDQDLLLFQRKTAAVAAGLSDVMGESLDICNCCVVKIAAELVYYADQGSRLDTLRDSLINIAKRERLNRHLSDEQRDAITEFYSLVYTDEPGEEPPTDVEAAIIAKLAAPVPEFLEYVKSFYGPGGIYDMGASDAQIKEATAIHLVQLSVLDETEFLADSTDRERVREILKAKFGLAFPESSKLRLVDEERG